jgi:hypothetical protein
MRAPLFAVALAGCGFLDPGGGACDEWCGFVACALNDVCEDAISDDFPDACRDACEESLEGFREREQNVIRECTACVDEVTGSECRANALEEVDQRCEKACNNAEVDRFVETFFGEIELDSRCT